MNTSEQIKNVEKHLNYLKKALEFCSEELSSMKRPCLSGPLQEFAGRAKNDSNDYLQSAEEGKKLLDKISIPLTFIHQDVKNLVIICTMIEWYQEELKDEKCDYRQFFLRSLEIVVQGFFVDLRSLLDHLAAIALAVLIKKDNLKDVKYKDLSDNIFQNTNNIQNIAPSLVLVVEAFNEFFEAINHTRNYLVHWGGEISFWEVAKFSKGVGIYLKNGFEKHSDFPITFSNQHVDLNLYVGIIFGRVICFLNDFIYEIMEILHNLKVLNLREKLDPLAVSTRQKLLNMNFSPEQVDKILENPDVEITVTHKKSSISLVLGVTCTNKLFHVKQTIPLI